MPAHEWSGTTKGIVCKGCGAAIGTPDSPVCPGSSYIRPAPEKGPPRPLSLAGKMLLMENLHSIAMLVHRKDEGLIR